MDGHPRGGHIDFDNTIPWILAAKWETRWLGWAGLRGLAWREAAFGNGFDVVIMKAGLVLGCLCVRVFFSGFYWVALVLVLESERASV